MAATLADGGVNPLTAKRVVDAEICWRVLAVMATSGLCERSGDWVKGGLGTFAPKLDAVGNSVRGRFVTKYLSHRMGLNLFASEAGPAEVPEAHR